MTHDQIRKAGIAAAMAVNACIEGNTVTTVDVEVIAIPDSANVARVTFNITVEDIQHG